jgi:hypothetical protein
LRPASTIGADAGALRRIPPCERAYRACDCKRDFFHAFEALHFARLSLMCLVHLQSFRLFKIEVPSRDIEAVPVFITGTEVMVSVTGDLPFR